MKAAQKVQDLDAEVDDDHQGSAFSMHTWFRSIADRVAGITTVRMFGDSLLCIDRLPFVRGPREVLASLGEEAALHL